MSARIVNRPGGGTGNAGGDDEMIGVRTGGGVQDHWRAITKERVDYAIIRPPAFVIVERDILLGAGKLGKQFQEAEKKQIPRVLILGENEVASGVYAVKTLATGEQAGFTAEQIIKL